MGVMTFRKAERRRKKARIALIGVTGGGKTWTALEIMRGLVGPEGRIALIDTERSTAELYSDRHAFDVLDLESFEAENYIAAIKAAVDAHYDGLIIDSWSHAWAGKGGILEFVDQRSKRSSSGSSFNAWGDATPKQHAMVDAILSAPLHIICTMRAKMAYVQERDERTGKTVIRKVGLQPVQRDGVEYEMDLVADMTIDNDLIVSKSRCSAFNGRCVSKPTVALGEELRAWLEGGTDTPAPPATGSATRVTINGREYQTAGIGKDALLSVWNLSAALDKRDGKGSAKELLSSALHVDTSSALTATTGADAIALLRSALEEPPVTPEGSAA